MTSQQRAELIRGHADAGQDAAQCTPRDVSPSVYRHGDRAPVWMAHDVMTAVDPCDLKANGFESLDDLRSRYGRDGARHKAANYQRSGDVECQRHLVRYPHFLNEEFQAGAQVGKRLFLGLSLAERGRARTKLGRGAPNAVLILLDDVGHVNDSTHVSIIAYFWPFNAALLAVLAGGAIPMPRLGRLGTS
jgi:hypothetical protein